ncbi:hypothetical protein EB233_09070 [Mesorhizobium erdmanii]|uniref:Uncharacterized protein n=1 Tax=Mesorhizobium erdmanii TaxID=1777866 RepID=A0A6M7UCY7_9HYPH|nr:hypothetical protein A8146_20065 [Mesorhizobium loti]QKC75669.1 hypothetical protein EB233_09070 [Mesorhizobium erdmanii]
MLQHLNQIGSFFRHQRAPFLSLRRGERWLGEAETEWGKAVLKCQAADKRARPSRSDISVS